ncbi:MAG TPA: glycine oxidase ThiO [Candidatus Acidoferrales bacterium]|nr:glycine oxidase ThiO [Candidatus Acidoferrales bacterium]
MKTFDVAIIGGGVIGASIAFELAGQKLRVIVLDRQQPGQEASWAAAGMLSPGPHLPGDLPLVPLGQESLRLYPQFVAAVEEASGKSAAYARDGALEIFLPPRGEAERDKLVSEYRDLGLAAEPISLDTVRQWEKSINPAMRAAAWLPEEGTVEPRALMDAVLTAARRRGVEIRSDCPVTGLLREHDHCTGVVAGSEKIVAAHVVVAAGCFCGEIARDGDLLTRYAPTRPVRGQMLALRAESVSLQRVLRAGRGYLVPRRDGRIVVGSTLENAGFEKRVTAGGVRQMLDAALEMLPGLAGAELVESWAGLRPGTPDDLPILGPTDVEGLLIATGHHRNGVLLAPVTAKLVREWILNGGTTFEAEAFSPLRFSSHHPVESSRSMSRGT